MTITSTGYKIGKQPIAQSFFIDEPKGIYCTKLDLFLKTADTAAPIQVQIRPMINGVPSSNIIIPGSIKALPGSTFSGGASVSADATTATEFRFDEPVYLQGQTDFALVVIADSKDYEIFIAEINEFVVGSTEKRINKQPILGSLFYTQNGVTFTPAQNQDLTFRIHKAKFKYTSAKVRLSNASVPKRLLSNNPIKTSTGSTTVQVFHPNHGLQVGDPVIISGVDSAGVGGIFASTLNKRYNIVSRDYTGYTFTADSAADSDATAGGSLVKATKNIPYNTIYPHVNGIIPTGSRIEAKVKTITGKSFAGTETAFQTSDFETIDINENNSTDILKLVAHDSAETQALGAGNKSLDMEIALSSTDSDGLPMLDLQRCSVNLISNVIDKQASSVTDGFNVPLNFVDETSNIGGSASAKHLTKAITLEEEAVGLKVIITAFRPDTADFELYFRSCGEDESIRDQNYILVQQEAFIPSDDNQLLFRDYNYLIGGLGGNLDAFKKFQLKIVFRSTNQAKVPVISSLRTIALSV